MFFSAEIYREQLLDNEKQKALYEKVVLEHPDSLYYTESENNTERYEAIQRFREKEKEAREKILLVKRLNKNNDYIQRNYKCGRKASTKLG